MRDDRITQRREWQASQDRGLHGCHNLARFGAYHREAQDAVVDCADEYLHEAPRLVSRCSSEDAAHGERCDTDSGILFPRFLFRETNSRQGWIGKHHLGNQPVTGSATSSAHVVTNDSEVIDRDVRELWAAGAFSDRPNAWSGRL